MFQGFTGRYIAEPQSTVNLPSVISAKNIMSSDLMSLKSFSSRMSVDISSPFNTASGSTSCAASSRAASSGSAGGSAVDVLVGAAPALLPGRFLVDLENMELLGLFFGICLNRYEKNGNVFFFLFFMLFCLYTNSIFVVMSIRFGTSSKLKLEEIHLSKFQTFCSWKQLYEKQSGRLSMFWWHSQKKVTSHQVTSRSSSHFSIFWTVCPNQGAHRTNPTASWPYRHDNHMATSDVLGVDGDRYKTWMEQIDVWGLNKKTEEVGVHDCHQAF